MSGLFGLGLGSCLTRANSFSRGQLIGIGRDESEVVPRHFEKCPLKLQSKQLVSIDGRKDHGLN